MAGSDILKSAGKGASIGGMAGTVIPGIGNLVGGAVGAGAGALIGLLKGAGQGAGAKRDQRAADNLQPSLYDPQQQAFLAEINQKRKSINSGSAYAADMGDINQSQAGTNQAIVQTAGGDSAGTIQGLLAAQQGAGRLKNQVLGQAGQEGQFYNTFGNNLLANISGRAMQLQLAQQTQKRAQWAQKSQDSFANITNGVARMGDGGGSEMNWLDMFQRHESPNLGGADMGNAEQQAMNMKPIQSMLSPETPVDPGMTGLPFDFSSIGIGSGSGIPTF